MPFAVLFQDEPKSVALLLSIGVFVWAAIHGERIMETARSTCRKFLSGAKGVSLALLMASFAALVEGSLVVSVASM